LLFLCISLNSSKRRAALDWTALIQQAANCYSVKQRDPQAFQISPDKDTACG